MRSFLRALPRRQSCCDPAVLLCGDRSLGGTLHVSGTGASCAPWYDDCFSSCWDHWVVSGRNWSPSVRGLAWMRCRCPFCVVICWRRGVHGLGRPMLRTVALVIERPIDERRKYAQRLCGQTNDVTHPLLVARGDKRWTGTWDSRERK